MSNLTKIYTDSMERGEKTIDTLHADLIFKDTLDKLNLSKRVFIV